MGEQGDCLYCGRPLTLKGFKRKGNGYCSIECTIKDRGMSGFAKRLYDGSRLQSDDFGEEPGDDLVTYQ